MERHISIKKSLIPIQIEEGVLYQNFEPTSKKEPYLNNPKKLQKMHTICVFLFWLNSNPLALYSVLRARPRNCKIFFFFIYKNISECSIGKTIYSIIAIIASTI